MPVNIASVGHVKLMVEAGDSFLIGNLTGNGDKLSIRGSAVTGSEARLTIIARVQMAPEELETNMHHIVVSTSKGRLTTTPVAWRCLSPGRPNLTHFCRHLKEPTIELKAC